MPPAFTVAEHADRRRGTGTRPGPSPSSRPRPASRSAGSASGEAAFCPSLRTRTGARTPGRRPGRQRRVTDGLRRRAGVGGTGVVTLAEHPHGRVRRDVPHLAGTDAVAGGLGCGGAGIADPAFSPSLSTRTGARASASPTWALPVESWLCCDGAPAPSPDSWFWPSLRTRTGTSAWTEPAWAPPAWSFELCSTATPGCWAALSVPSLATRTGASTSTEPACARGRRVLRRLRRGLGRGVAGVVAIAGHAHRGVHGHRSDLGGSGRAGGLLDRVSGRRRGGPCCQRQGEHARSERNRSAFHLTAPSDRFESAAGPVRGSGYRGAVRA